MAEVEVEERNIANRDGDAGRDTTAMGDMGIFLLVVWSPRAKGANNTSRLVVMQVLEGQEHTGLYSTML